MKLISGDKYKKAKKIVKKYKKQELFIGELIEELKRIVSNIKAAGSYDAVQKKRLIEISEICGQNHLYHWYFNKEFHVLSKTFSEDELRSIFND